MLVAFLNPFDWPSGFASRDRQQHDVGEDGMLGAEAATRIRGRFEAQPVGRDAERHGHYRMHRQRPLEIGGDLVHALTGQIFGDHHKALDRGA